MAKTYSNVRRPPDEPIQNISQFHQSREWLDLKALTRYASISERTMRQWIHRASNPLPAVRVGAKILVRRSEFDRWLENHRLEPMDVGCIVNEMVADLVDTNSWASRSRSVDQNGTSTLTSRVGGRTGLSGRAKRRKKFDVSSKRAWSSAT